LWLLFGLGLAINSWLVLVQSHFDELTIDSTPSSSPFPILLLRHRHTLIPSRTPVNPSRKVLDCD
ncbi:hypothetical protein A4X13_0g8817, partial [Tilletia indica]